LPNRTIQTLRAPPTTAKLLSQPLSPAAFPKPPRPPRRTRGIDIIDQKHLASVYFLGTPHGERSAHILLALMDGQPDLRFRFAFPFQNISAKNHFVPKHSVSNRAPIGRKQFQRCPGDQLRVVEAALPPLRTMQRHRDNQHGSRFKAGRSAESAGGNGLS
jgi:hypothetical protein